MAVAGERHLVTAETALWLSRRGLGGAEVLAQVANDWLDQQSTAGLREWQGRTYPAAGWPAILDVDTHERLVRLFADPARRRHVVRAPAHLLSMTLRIWYFSEWRTRPLPVLPSCSPN